MIPLKTHYNPITPIQNIQQILIVDIVYRDILCPTTINYYIYTPIPISTPAYLYHYFGFLLG